MIVFWLICAVMVAIALLFVIPPLLQSGNTDQAPNEGESNVAVYRDQLSELEADLRNGIVSEEQYQLDKDEIERRLLDDVSDPATEVRKRPGKATRDRRLVYAVALGIPLVALALYLRLGNPAAISDSNAPRETSVAANPPGEGPMTREGIEANVARLAKRLEENPQDAAGWAMLGRSYINFGKYREASDAYARATAIKADDADLWADYAFALAMANEKQLRGKPTELIEKALALDPENPKAIELAGSAAFEAKNYKKALDYWQRLLAKSPPNSELAQSLSDRIKRAEELVGGGR